MDQQTLALYNQHAADLCARYRRAAPVGLYDMIRAWFHAGAATADIGCGSGRDVAWFADHGFAAVGYDASPAMLAEARAAYPNIDVRVGALPDLNTIPDDAYANILCAATLMHVPRTDIITAVLSLARILRPAGRMILAYRASTSAGEREPDGRLYTSLPTGKLTLLLESAGLHVLHTTTLPDATRPTITWHTLVVERSPLDVARGLERIQAVLAQDRKVATYKFALIRALCGISRTQAHLAQWHAGRVYVPLWSVAVQWLIFYWPLITHPVFIAQQRGEKPGGHPVAVRPVIEGLAHHYGTDRLDLLLTDLDTTPAQFLKSISKIATTIKAGPVAHAGGSSTPIFTWAKQAPHTGNVAPMVQRYGWIEIPEPIWLDVTRFEHWIEDSIVLRWARLTAEMNQDASHSADERLKEALPLLLTTPTAERDTLDIRRLLTTTGSTQPITCVWSGKETRSFAVDHVIPYATWINNDLWNLLPSLPKLNTQKSDALPTRQLLLSRKTAITAYWQRYLDTFEQRFAVQIERSLGCAVQQPGWEHEAFSGLQETIERLATTRGLHRWEP